MTTTTNESAARWTPRTRELDVGTPVLGRVPLRLGGRDRTQPYLLLHGGAGPASVAAFGDLLAGRDRARVLVPTHPGFDGTPRPAGLGSVRDLAAVYAALLDDLDLWDVTVIGNSLGGWIAAELALLESPRVSGAVLVDAVGAAVPGHPVADVRTLAPSDLARLSFADPARMPAPGPGGPSRELLMANLDALYTYGGDSMTDPTLLGRLAHLDLPVHVVWGEADGVVTPDHAHALADAIPVSHLTLLPGAGHLPQLEQPELLLGALHDLGEDQK